MIPRDHLCGATRGPLADLSPDACPSCASARAGIVSLRSSARPNQSSRSAGHGRDAGARDGRRMRRRGRAGWGDES